MKGAESQIFISGKVIESKRNLDKLINIINSYAKELLGSDLDFLETFETGFLSKEFHLSTNKKDSQISYLITIKLKNILIIDDYLERLAKDLFLVDRISYISVNISPLVGEIMSSIDKQNSEYTPINVGNLGGISYMSIYPEQSQRAKVFVNLPDSFYFGIPAIKVEPILNYGILVKSFNLNDTLDKQSNDMMSVLDYYVAKKKELGIWKKVILWPGWRETYREILEEKGLL